MSRKEIEKTAFDYLESGFCCSESILMATMESRTTAADHELPKVATGLCGGVGGSHEEMCGALSGAVLAIGLLYGRTQPGADVQFARDLAVEYRRRFIEEFGTANCGKLLECFGEQDNGDKCRLLTATAAGLLSDLLDEGKP